MNFAKMLATSTVVLASLLPFSVLAQSFTVKDVAGREVKFDKPVERVILGEGRMLYSVAPIEKEDPFARIVGWRNDLLTTDKDGYDAYLAKFPKGKELPFLGNLTDGTLQTETVVKLNPDVMLLPIGNKKAADEVKLEDMLNKIGVKIVYIDFREHILDNTEPSLKVLGQIFGHEDRAAAVAAYWKQQMARVTDKLKAANPKKPNVFMYRAAGLVECCGTFGPDNFGLMVDWAGGHNLGSDFLPGYTGSINAEQVVASNPDVVVVTGSNWSQTKDAKDFVNVGPNAAPAFDGSRKALDALMQNAAFTGSKAAAGGNVHAIWHQFYTSPYQFVAVQRMAKWFHPELFADLDPDATFKEFHEKFLPVPYQPGYWIDAKAAK
ncbi:ABC transporter substrate-binding protein [Neorhizobium sp. BETTINA12A]|uniref:ABC transporter substrate-binding protein n=1 Tax=Neorhizobium sp. BETTINA12A TaxID=2908924 RepID=UPI001FF45D99|nr:ABC transporter substrate-binding protein [Neorhizobium sp. BETTINA12A]MCJ9752609.1 ABC transporter substrate-binding protein [Neorhizobium sp. BETTINA12A]